MRRALLFCVASLAAGCNGSQCDAVANSSSFGAFAVGLGGAFLNVAQFLFAGSNSGPAWGCTVSDSQPTRTQALDPEAGACGPDPTDDACVACAKAACCTESLACLAEVSCTCLVACSSLGAMRCPAGDREGCGAEDDVYVAAVACVEQRCAGECPGQ